MKMRFRRGWQLGVPADESRMRATTAEQKRRRSGACTLDIYYKRIHRKEATDPTMRRATQPTSPHPDRRKNVAERANNSVTQRRAAVAHN